MCCEYGEFEDGVPYCDYEDSMVEENLDNSGEDWFRYSSIELDDCEICHGEKGGVRGNENIVNGIVMCDYCTVEYDTK
jgi:hypothetical protein